MKLNLSSFWFACVCLNAYLLIAWSQKYYSMLSSIRITVLTPTFMFIIHFKLIFTWHVLIVKIVLIFLIFIGLWTTISEKAMAPTPVLLPGKSHGRRSLVGCSPWGRYESGTTERLHFHFSLSCIGEGNGNPVQRSCLENPRDGGAWWAAIYGVTQSRTRLKWLNSNSSSSSMDYHLVQHHLLKRLIQLILLSLCNNE